jgi:hypothetical protein
MTAISYDMFALLFFLFQQGKFFQGLVSFLIVVSQLLAAVEATQAELEVHLTANIKLLLCIFFSSYRISFAWYIIFEYYLF